MIIARNYLDVYPYDKWNAKVIFTEIKSYHPLSSLVLMWREVGSLCSLTKKRCQEHILQTPHMEAKHFLLLYLKTISDDYVCEKVFSRRLWRTCSVGPSVLLVFIVS